MPETMTISQYSPGFWGQLTERQIWYVKAKPAALQGLSITFQKQEPRNRE
jgi:hypothetical protein